MDVVLTFLGGVWPFARRLVCWRSRPAFNDTTRSLRMPPTESPASKKAKTSTYEHTKEVRPWDWPSSRMLASSAWNTHTELRRMHSMGVRAHMAVAASHSTGWHTADARAAQMQAFLEVFSTLRDEAITDPIVGKPPQFSIDWVKEVGGGGPDRD